jgi:ribosomal protein S18 acetylase RimI-like enzyme
MHDAPVLSWASSYAEWAEAANFFAAAIQPDVAYISHGEMQTGLSLDGRTWAPNLAARFLKELGEFDETRSVALARDGDGAIVAAVNVTWDTTSAETPFATLQDMAVAPSLREKGIGAAMLGLVKAEADRRKMRWIFLESGKNNHRAHAFFASHGFEEISHVFCLPCGPN